jgi:polysaccharide pyruvyl transferase WcaK-like protein
MWKLTEEHCVQIPQGKAESVLVTFTEYNQNPSLDKQLVELLKQEYKLIYYWTQQPKDYQHMKDICGEGAIYLNPSLSALDMALSQYPVDYVGTRLHAGIRALQYKRRALILSVDNRATEISKDTNLPVVQRDDLNSVANWINAKKETLVKIPLTAINEWKNQFLATVNNY